MLRQDDTGWSNPRVLAVLAVVFLCGAAIGSALTSHYLHMKLAASARAVDMQLLRAELALTPTQEKIVTQELDDYAKYYQNIEDEREDVAEHGKQRILDVLNPEQRKRFNEIFPRFPR
jgi:hypothetical protein